MPAVLVVKCGGNAAVAVDGVCADVAALHRQGHQVVVVHGGSADIDALAGRLAVANDRLSGSGGGQARRTDAAMLEVVQLALCGAAKPRLVTGLARHGVAAVGLTGLDAALLRARRIPVRRAVVDGRPVVVRDLMSGRIVGVNTRLLRVLLDAGLVPVVSPPVLDEHNEAVNCDADRVASAVAVALRADSLVMLTGAPGLLRDPVDERSVITEIGVEDGTPDGFAGGGMAVKVAAAAEALSGGVADVRIADGRVDRPVSAAIAGGGTKVRP